MEDNFPLASFSSRSSTHCSARQVLDEPGSASQQSAFELMCREYEVLRVRALSELIAEAEFLTVASRSPCFFANPNLFAEVHELWLTDFARAQMHRVDPFQGALLLLRSHLNPLDPEEKLQRRRLRSEVLGPLKNPRVEFEALPFALPPSQPEMKTSLKKQLAQAPDEGTAEDSSGSGRFRTFLISLAKKV